MPQGTLSLFCNNLYGKRIWRRIDICICITEPLCCNLKLTQCCRSTIPPNKTKIEKKFTLKFFNTKARQGSREGTTGSACQGDGPSLQVRQSMAGQTSLLRGPFSGGLSHAGTYVKGTGVQNTEEGVCLAWSGTCQKAGVTGAQWPREGRQQARLECSPGPRHAGLWKPQ